MPVKVYEIDFTLYFTHGTYGVPFSNKRRVKHTVPRLQQANMIVDEIIQAQTTGHKSAFVIDLEESLGGVIKMKDNAVHLSEISTKVLRKEGALHSIMKKKRRDDDTH